MPALTETKTPARFFEPASAPLPVLLFAEAESPGALALVLPVLHGAASAEPAMKAKAVAVAMVFVSVTFASLRNLSDRLGRPVCPEKAIKEN